MNKVSEQGNSAPSPLPPRGLSLGWRLALSAALIIMLVMGVVSVSQQLFMLEKDRQVHEMLLKTSLVPLAVRLEAAFTLDSMRQEMEQFHDAYVKLGYPVHEVVLVDTAGKQILSTDAAMTLEKTGHFFLAEIPISSPVLSGGTGALKVLKSNEEYRKAVIRNWSLWAAHFSITVGAVFLFLAIALYYQVTKPINRLVQGIRKMEMGYWGPVELSRGAWEIRWLAWRFGNMVQEVRNVVTHLFEAEQKSRPLMVRTGKEIQLTDSSRFHNPVDPVSDATNDPEYQELLNICRRLETAAATDRLAIQIARGIWQRESLMADQLGYHHLKTRLEDAALRLMEPEACAALESQLAGLKKSWQGWVVQHRDDLRLLMEKHGIPCVAVLHRVKHMAGVWTKMQSKGLNQEEVQDLFAFRIVVPTEADCYTALGVIHHAYKPLIGRFKDYIARPKENGYQSLHTCVTLKNGPVFEVQIRSIVMDQQAERGSAAHWTYKKQGRAADQLSAKNDWWHKLRWWSQRGK